MAALLRLTAHPSEAVIRRALKLLTTSLASISQHDIQVRTLHSSMTAHLMFMSMFYVHVYVTVYVHVYISVCHVYVRALSPGVHLIFWSVIAWLLSLNGLSISRYNSRLPSTCSADASAISSAA